MASAYLLAMLAITPLNPAKVALIANPEFEAGPAAGHRARRLTDGGNPGFSDPFLLMPRIGCPGTLSRGILIAGSKPSRLLPVRFGGDAVFGFGESR
jgi:hypothetical protein